MPCAQGCRTIFSALATCSILACSGEAYSPPIKPGSHGGVAPADGTHLLDPSYGGDGSTEGFPVPVAFGHYAAVVTDRFDRVLIAGGKVHVYAEPTYDCRATVVRVDPNGEFDTTFGDEGMAFGEGEYPGHVTGASVSVDAFDRIIVAASVDPAETGIFEEALVGAVFRFNDDGTADTTFGEGGRVLIESEHEDWTTGMIDAVADGSGRVLILGIEREPVASPGVLPVTHMFVARLLEDGSLDPGFGTGGIARGPETVSSSGAALVADMLGRPLVAGHVNRYDCDLAVWRFQADGLPDLSFGENPGGGMLLSSGPGGQQATSLQGVDLALDSAGRVLVASNHATDIQRLDRWPLLKVWPVDDQAPIFDSIVWRFTSDGLKDPTFGFGGMRAVKISSGQGDHFDVATSLRVDPADGVIMAGYSAEPTWDAHYGFYTYAPSRVAVTRLTEAGAYDESFNGVGHALLSEPRADGLALDSQGRLVLVGIGETVDAMAWRLTD